MPFKINRSEKQSGPKNRRPWDLKLNHKVVDLSTANKVSRVVQVTHKYLDLEYDAVKTSPEISSRRSKVLWLTESKAADRSSRANIARSPLPTAVKMSESTVSTAVSVLWCAPYANIRHRRIPPSTGDLLWSSWRHTVLQWFVCYSVCSQ